MTRLPLIYLVDVDGTLALKREGAGERSWFDWHRVGEDMPNPPVVHAVQQLSAVCQIVCMTARNETCRQETSEWLAEQGIVPALLLMRKKKDYRPDAEVKRELYLRHVCGIYEVLAVLEDRESVVKMWREELGLTVFQVAPGQY
jgi:hypothetical protein